MNLLLPALAEMFSFFCLPQAKVDCNHKPGAEWNYWPRAMKEAGKREQKAN